MSSLDQSLAFLKGETDSLGTSSVPTSPDFQQSLDYLKGGTEPGLGSKVLHGIGSVLGAPKGLVDAGARAVARAEGIPIPDDATTGRMLRAAIGLDPNEANTIPQRLAGKVAEFATDVATDPLTVALAGMGGAAQAGRGAEAAIAAGERLAPGALGALTPEALSAAEQVAQTGARAAAVQKGAGAAFTGLMGAGALEEGSHAYDTLKKEGLSPNSAEQLLGTALSAGGAYLGGRHLLKEGPTALEQAIEEPKQSESFSGLPQEAPAIPEDWYGRMPVEVPERLATPSSSGIPDSFPELNDPAQWYGRLSIPEPSPRGVDNPVPVDKPQYAFRARDVGEQGVPTERHAQATMSEADARRLAPSRTENPQEIVRFDLSKLTPDQYEIKPGPSGTPWVYVKNGLPESVLEKVGPVTGIDAEAASKATPETAQAVLSADQTELGQKAGLTPEQTAKGTQDVRDDGTKEFSPEAVAVKKAALESMAQRIGANGTEPPITSKLETEADAQAVESSANERIGSAKVHLDEPRPEADVVANGNQARPGTEGGSGENAGRPLESRPPMAEGTLGGQGGLRPEPGGSQPVETGVQAEPHRVPAGQLVESPNVKLPTVYQQEGKPVVPASKVSPSSADLLPEQVKAIQDAGLKDFPWIKRDASKLIFDGDGALASLKSRGQGKAFDLGGAAAEGAGVLRDVITYGASLIEKGIRSFPEWSKEMTAQLGSSIRNLGYHLNRLWQEAHGAYKKLQRAMDERYGPSEQGAFKFGGKPAEAQGPTAQSAPQAKPIKPIPTKAQAVPNAKPVTAWDKILEGWKSGLVSGPGTHVVNPASGLAEAGIRAGEAGLAGVVDRLLGGPRTRFSGEALEQVRGGIASIPRAAKALSEGIRGVLDSEGAIEGTKGKIIRGPLQMLGVEDATTRALNEGAVRQGVSYREALRGGGSTAQVRARQAQILKDNTADFLSKVEKEVNERQFKNTDPESLVKKISKLRDTHKWLHVPLPFLDTPGAIAKLTIDRTPVGFVEGVKAYKAYKEALAKGVTGDALAELKGNAVDKLTRPLLGTTVIGLFTTVAAAGAMTGSGPADPKQRALLRDSGWQPYSFHFGDTYVPFSRFQPVSSLLGFAADLVESKDAKTSEEMFSKALGSVGQQIASQTFLKGLADASEFIANPSQFAGQYVKNLATSAVPNIVAKTAEALDPIYRDTKASESGLAGIPEGVYKGVAARIPGLSQTLPAKMNVLGQEQERPGNALSRLLSPVQITEDKPEGDVERLMAQAGVSGSIPKRQLAVKGKKIDLTDQEYDALNKANELAADFIRRKYIGNSEFESLPDTIEEGGSRSKEALIRRVFTNARSQATSKIKNSSMFAQRFRQA